MFVNIFYDDEGKDADIIELPELVIDDLEELQERFLRWMFDKKNKHQYWRTEGNRKYCVYDSEAFVEWINKMYLESDKEVAKVLTKNVDNVNEDDPVLFF